MSAVPSVTARREPHETLASLVARITDSPAQDRAGAVATFTGRVRELDAAEDASTKPVYFKKYDGLAADQLATIRRDLLDRDGVNGVELYHRTGIVEAGENIVFVVILAGHRQEAFRAVEDGIDRLKDEVSLFKKEVIVEDAQWAQERQ